jgi:hypothetical protein
MKTIRTTVISLLAVVSLTVATVRIQAQPKPLILSLTAVYQLPEVARGSDQNITISSTKQVKFTSDFLLDLIAANENFSPKGYILIYDPIADIVGTTNTTTGDFEADSSLLSIDTSGIQVYSGSANSDTGRQSETYTTYVTVTFDDDNGNSFTVAGLVKSSQSVPALTAAQANQGITPNETISFSGNLSGYGTAIGSDGNSDTAVFSGSISGGGSGQAD